MTEEKYFYFVEFAGLTTGLEKKEYKCIQSSYITIAGCQTLGL